MMDEIYRAILKSIKQVYDFIRIISIYYAHEGPSLLFEVTLLF